MGVPVENIGAKSVLSAEAEAALMIFQAAETLGKNISELLKPYGVTSTQYNVLRILRGAGCSGLARSQVSERMLTHDPDVSRLLDRMEVQGWVTRQRSCQDRRVVITKITPDALSLLKNIDGPLAEKLKATVGQLGSPVLSTLIKSLADVRASLK